jgi:uncharacterized protein
MTLRERLDDDLKKALKQGEKLRLSVLRMLRSEMKYLEIKTREPISEEELLELLGRYARKRKEAAAEFEKGERPDLVEKELAEFEIVSSYLPKALDSSEVEKIVDQVISDLGASGMKEMGAVMKEVLNRTSGRSDGATVSALVKGRLSA